MTQKRILVVSNTTFYGGGEHFIYSILQHIDNTFFIVRDNILYSKLPSERTILFKRKNRYKELSEIDRAIKEWNIDSIILNGGSSIYYAPFIKKADVIIYRHTTNSCVVSYLKRLLYIFILHFCYCFAKKVIHVSNFSKKEQKLFKNKAVTIYNGSNDINKMSIIRNHKNKPLKILYIGRITKAKGINELIKSVSSFSEDQVILNIVGDGDLLPSLKKEFSSNQIIFHGFKNNVDDYYRNNDILISLSYTENCPLSIIDAMKWGLPIITTPVGGVPELVENSNNGFLVKNENEVETAIQYFIDNNSYIDIMGRNSRILYEEKFNSTITINTIKKTLKEI